VKEEKIVINGELYYMFIQEFEFIPTHAVVVCTYDDKVRLVTLHKSKMKGMYFSYKGKRCYLNTFY